MYPARNSMKVSAVIPTFNRRAYIRRAIDSVFAQTVSVDEVIVVDDGSTDGTAQAVEAWYGPRVRVVRQQRAGVSGARKCGINEACGDWIAFLDSDDEWTPERNKTLLEAAVSVPADVAWIFGDLRVVTDDGYQTTLFEEHGLSVTDSPHIFADPLTVQFPFQFGMLQGSFIRRGALLELDCFSAGLRSDDDLLTGFQVACRYNFAAIPDVVGRYFRTSDLEASSVVVNGVYGPDHFRSRMMAFALVIESGRRRPWNKRYASEVRGLCQLLASQGPVSRRMAMQQFRFGGLSAKGVAFLCAAMAGRRGILAWNKVAELRRRVRQTPAIASKNSGFQAYVQSVVAKKLDKVQ
jgi:glycosyltransferase involved in cell wall biosynthesis